MRKEHDICMEKCEKETAFFKQLHNQPEVSDYF